MSRRQADRRSPAKRWIRRCHRWIGVGVSLFLLLLATTGIALNHVDDWRLDQRYIDWPWLLDAYGVHAPEPAASFADLEHRVTLIAGRLYFDGRPVADETSALTGLVVAGAMAVAGLDDAVLVMTTSGEIVEYIDLSSQLDVPIDRIGKLGNAVVIESGGTLLISDADITGFAAPPILSQEEPLVWSRASVPSGDEMSVLAELHRGRGITAERFLADLHSGRVFSAMGRLFMDFVAILLIVLSVSGFILWTRRNGKA